LTPAAPATFVMSLSKDGRALQLTTVLE